MAAGIEYGKNIRILSSKENYSVRIFSNVSLFMYNQRVLNGSCVIKPSKQTHID